MLDTVVNLCPVLLLSACAADWMTERTRKSSECRSAGQRTVDWIATVLRDLISGGAEHVAGRLGGR